MKQVIIALALLSSTASFAAASKAPAEYLVAGHIVDAPTAIAAAMKGETVYQLKPVVLSVSKAGTSIGLHAPKKQKSLASK